MGATHPADTLSKLLPESSLLGLPTIVSVLGSVAIQLGTQLPLFFGFKNNPYNERAKFDVEDRTSSWPCDVNTILFQLSVFQLIVTSISFSVSHPFRKPIYENYLFTFFAFANLFFAFFFIVLNEVQWVQDVFFVSENVFLLNTKFYSLKLYRVVSATGCYSSSWETLWWLTSLRRS